LPNSKVESVIDLNSILSGISAEDKDESKNPFTKTRVVASFEILNLELSEILPF